MPQQAMQQGAPMPAAPAGAGMPPMPSGLQNSQSAGVWALFQQAQQMAQQIFDIGVIQGPGARRSALI